MQSKPERSEGFDVIIRPAPQSAGRTTPEQTGHYSHYNTKLTNSQYFHRNSYHIALTESQSRTSCSWKSSEHCHPLCTLIKAIARIVLNKGHKLTAWLDACASKCSVRVLICVWSQMSCCKWLKLSSSAAHQWDHRTRYAKLWRYNDLIYAHYYHWRFCQKL